MTNHQTQEDILQDEKGATLAGVVVNISEREASKEAEAIKRTCLTIFRALTTQRASKTITAPTGSSKQGNEFLATTAKTHFTTKV